VLDEFFQKLREIQKKERNLSGLAPVGEDFYQNISRYFNVLMKKIDDNPFSFESYLLRDAQRITAEICERREHKISNSAVMSVQRSHHLFKEIETDHPITPKIPRNSTPEEEKLFHTLVDSLIHYRDKMMDPLKFHNSQAKDRKEDLNQVDSYSTGNKPDKLLDQKDEGEKNLKVPPDIKDDFSAEEKAAIEDDIYKQFGKEPFPGSGQEKEKSIMKNSGGGPLYTESKTPSTDKTKPSAEETQNNNKSDNKMSEQLKTQNIQTDMLVVLEELPPIMGIDKKVYGPLSPQDIVTIPEPTARILVKNQKGKSIQKYKLL
jgi:DNA replication factor GINS